MHNRCSDFASYRAARVKSLFNAESGCNFDLVAELPIDDADWRIGVIVGPSGSGKTSLGRQIWGGEHFYRPTGWPKGKPIIDAIAPKGDFDAVTAALAAVGLGNVPAWLRPYEVLSNGEKFRADLARIVADQPAKVVVDEFTSVVDRQIAKVGAAAFAKAWRRTGGGQAAQAILLTCHYDVLDWLEPDWTYDTSSGVFARGQLRRRPRFDLEIHETNWRFWPLFEPHHYLKLARMPAATNYVGTVDDELVCHVAVAPRRGLVEARACRLVVMPEWQGAGVGMRFLNAVCEEWRQGRNRFAKPLRMLFHTSHPGLAAALRRDAKWRQCSAILYGRNRVRCAASLARWARASKNGIGGGGYGGHFRAVQGFRYYGA